jgi:hypothetical protein
MGKKISMKELSRRIERLGDDAREAIVDAIQRSALRLQALVPDAIQSTSPYPPINTGELARSPKMTPHENGAVVVADAPHAAYMEWGTRPFTPPLMPLAEWALMKGLAETAEDAIDFALNLRDKFRREGIAPRFYMKRALADYMEENDLGEEIKKAMEKIEGA